MADKIRISRRRNYREQLRLYLNLTKRLNAKLKKLFRQASRKASTKYAQGMFVDDIFMTEYADDLYKILANQYRTVITQSAKRITEQRFKKADDEVNTIIEAYIITHTATEVTRISETTKKLLSATILKGIKDGDSIEDISKSIRKSNAFSENRATLIARTETHGAMNAGNMAITKTLALSEPVKEWNSAMDERARYYHKSMDGTVVGINATFVVMTPTKYGVVPKHMRYTGDSNGGAANVCNCRCFTSYYDSEDEVIDAVPQKPVIAPDLPIPEELVVVDPITPIKFVGFGRTTDKEKEYHKDSWGDTGVEKNIIAKFESVPITDVRGKDAYFLGYTGQVDSINMPRDLIGYEAQAVWRHEYGHNADFQAVTRLVYDKNKSPSNIYGWGSNLNSTTSRITPLLKVTAKNKVSAKAIILRAESPKMDNLKYASQIYTKEIIKDSSNLVKKYNPKYTRDELIDNNVILLQRNNIRPNADGIIRWETAEKREKFLNDIIEDGIVFKKDEIRKMYDTKLLAQYSEVEFRYIANKFLEFNFYNKKGILGNAQDTTGAFKALTGVGNFVTIRNDAVTKMIVTNKEDVLIYADYVGALTKEKVGFGHGISYYEKAGLGGVKIGRRVVKSRESTEAYANYISLSGSPNKEIWKSKMTEMTPNVKQGFDELTEEILKLPDLK